MSIRIYNDNISKLAEIVKQSDKATQYKVGNGVLWIPKAAIEITGKNAQLDEMHKLADWFTLDDNAQDLLLLLMRQSLFAF